MRNPYLPGITYRVMKSGKFRGKVMRFGEPRWKLIAIVYGDTFEEMEERQMAIIELLNERARPSTSCIIQHHPISHIARDLDQA